MLTSQISNEKSADLPPTSAARFDLAIAPSVPAEKASSEDAAAPANIRPGRRFYIAMTLVLLVGCFLRLWRLGHQSFWFDETATILRVSGDFSEVLNRLYGQGFTPGWYAMLWSWTWILHHMLHFRGAAAFTPGLLRLPGALLGCLTLPLMYLLARQFTDRSVSLVVLLLASLDPFFVYYSRDLKMYPAVICFTLANAVFFLMWQRGRDFSRGRRLAAITGWLVSGLLMTAVQTVSFSLVGIEIAWLLCRPRFRWWDAPVLVAGASAMTLLPVWWYTHRTNWVHSFIHHHGGLSWTSLYMGYSLKYFISVPSEQILGFLYPVWPPTNRVLHWFDLPSRYCRHPAWCSLPWVVHAEMLSIILVGMTLLLGSVAWPHRWRGVAAECGGLAGRWWHIALWVGLPYGILLLSGLPSSNPLSIFPHLHIPYSRTHEFLH